MYVCPYIYIRIHVAIVGFFLAWLYGDCELTQSMYPCKPTIFCAILPFEGYCTYACGCSFSCKYIDLFHQSERLHIPISGGLKRIKTFNIFIEYQDMGVS